MTPSSNARHRVGTGSARHTREEGSSLPMSRTDEESQKAKEVAVFSDVRLARALALRLVAPRHTHSGEQAMHVAEGRTEECPGIAPRQRDRRRGLGDVVAYVARAV